MALSVVFVGSDLVAQSQVDVADLVHFDSSPLDRRLNGGVVSYANSLKEARPAVVSVYATATETPSEDEESSLMERFFGLRPHRWFPMRGLGSGVIVSENGYILTNNHVVGFADSIQVQLDNQRIYEATLVGADPGTDIAVIKIEETGLPTVRLADSDQIQVGDIVFAIGNPLGVGKTVTMGIVSATNRQDMGVIEGGFENFIQTDAPINTGNSGGALVDAMGRLIGINTLIQTDGASSGNIGIGFAVPSNLAYSVMADLVQSGSVARGFLGVGIESLDAEKAEFLGAEDLSGALVNLVSPDTPAATAGIEVGDVILALDGNRVASPSDLRIRIAGRKPGSSVRVELLRDGETREVMVLLARRDEVLGAVTVPEFPEARPLLEGVQLEASSEDLAELYGIDASLEGLVVVSVDGDSPHAGVLSEGTLILKVNKKPARTEAEFEAARLIGESNRLLIVSDGVYRIVSIEL